LPDVTPPQGKVEIVAAGQSDRGMEFYRRIHRHSFVPGSGINTIGFQNQPATDCWRQPKRPVAMS
jgi:hypothetical protein